MTQPLPPDNRSKRKWWYEDYFVGLMLQDVGWLTVFRSSCYRDARGFARHLNGVPSEIILPRAVFTINIGYYPGNDGIQDWKERCFSKEYHFKPVMDLKYFHMAKLFPAKGLPLLVQP